MLVEDFLREDKQGYFLDARATPYNWIDMDGTTVIKLRVLNKDWYPISQFAKVLGKKINSRQVAKNLNKIKDGSAVRIHAYAHSKMWFTTEDGLHQIFDDTLKLDSKNLPL